MVVWKARGQTACSAPSSSSPIVGARALAASLEHEARKLVVQRLHLLTTTAAPFFGTMGYAAADRHAAPPVIAASREFTSLCPASAAYLVKAL